MATQRMARTTVSLQSFVGGPVHWSSRGEKILFSRELARGGEGAVYEIEGHPELVAKVYLATVGSDRVAKLVAMSQIAAQRSHLLTLCAWPVATLHERQPAGALGGLTGFLMSRVSKAKEIHHLTGPVTRKREFPDRDWSFLVHVARNLASAFKVVHEAGALIGDVNESGFMVGEDGTIKILDCDSFQVAHGGRVFRCEVGKPEFTPPELQGLPGGFSSVNRTANHDHFGLAVLIFQLLMMGRHPFNGRYTGPGDPDTGAFIHDHRFAYGPDAASKQIAPAPHSLLLSDLSPGVANLFLRAFSPATDAGGRPDAGAWINALSEMMANLATCPVQAAHKHVKDRPCPWCRLENASGVVFFICGFSTISQTWTLNIAAMRRLIAQIPSFSLPDWPISAPAAVPGQPLPAALLQALKDRKISLPIRYAGCFVAAFVCCVISPWLGLIVLLIGLVVISVTDTTMKELAAIVRQRTEAHDQAVAAWERLHEAWKQCRPGVDARQRTLEQKLREYEHLDQAYRDGRKRLEDEKIEGQLHDFLQGFLVRDAKIKLVGKSKAAQLVGNGIETADDIDEEAIMSLHGFGEKITKNLLAWRQEIGARFVPNHQLPVDPKIVAAFHQKMEARRRTLENEINQTCMEISARVRAAQSQMDAVRAAERQARDHLNRTTADLAVAQQAA